MTNIKPGIYKHYKGNLYEVIGVATHSETKERYVIYRALSGDHELWARPEKMFTEDVDMPEYNYKGPRFTLVNPVRSKTPETSAVPISSERTSNGAREF